METRPWSSTPDNQSGTRENMTSYQLPDIPYFCGLCGYYFQTLYDLDLHVNNCPLDTPQLPQPNITPEVHEYFSPATEKCTLAINVMDILQSSMTLLYIRKHITQQCPLIYHTSGNIPPSTFNLVLLTTRHARSIEMRSSFFNVLQNADVS